MPRPNSDQSSRPGEDLLIATPTVDLRPCLAMTLAVSPGLISPRARVMSPVEAVLHRAHLGQSSTSISHSPFYVLMMSNKTQKTQLVATDLRVQDWTKHMAFLGLPLHRHRGNHSAETESAFRIPLSSYRDHFP